MIQKIVYFLSILSIFFGIKLQAQNVKITVIDESTLEVYPFANVVLYDLNDNFVKGDITNEKGEVEFDIDEPHKIEISIVGYFKYSDFILPGESKTVPMFLDFVGVEEVVITGQYTAKKVDQSIFRIDVINSKTMQERGVTNLAEALSNEAGIRLSIDPSTGTSIQMQGMGGENIKYLIDGVPIVGRVDGNIDLSQINMENVDHIEIVQGPMSVVYGTSALAGVVNIITKQNTGAKNLLKINSYSDTKYNYNFGGFASFIRGKHGLSLSANRDMFQGIDVDLNVTSESAKDRYMEFKPKRVFNSEAEYSFRNKNFQFKIKSQFMDLLLKNYSNPNPILIAYDADYFTTRSTNSLSVNNKISENLSFDAVGAYTYFVRKTDLISSDLVSLEKEVTGSNSTTFSNYMTRGSFAYARPASVLSYQFGWDINYENGKGDKIADGAEMGDFAAFASAQYLLSEKITLQPGFRYIYNTIYKAPLIPSINLHWELIKNLDFRVSYAKGFRAPSLKELYLDFKDSNHNLEGNKDLKAESTNSYNASISYEYQKNKNVLKIEPSFFFNSGKDVITLIVTDATSNSATNVNLGARQTFGGELNTSYLNYTGITLGFGFSRIAEKYDYDGTNEFTPLVYYNNYSFTSKYNWRRYNMVFTANAKIYGETPSLAIDEATDDFYQVYTEAFADIEASVTKLLWKEKISLILGAKNLLNYYEKRTYGYKGDQAEYLGPHYYGRVFFIKMNFKIDN